MNSISGVAVQLHGLPISPVCMNGEHPQEIAFLQHSRIMAASDPRSTEMNYDPIWRDHRLEFQGMNPFMTIVGLPLMDSWSRYGPDGAINESPAPTERGSFPVNSVPKVLQNIGHEPHGIKLEEMLMPCVQMSGELVDNPRYL